jgi:uncharacterized protein involved in outer membrane biogenesis
VINKSLIRKRLLIAAAVLVAVVLLVLVTLYAAVMTVDVAPYRKQVEALLSSSLEREISIGGAINLVPSLNPRFVVEDIQIANPSWASRPNFAAIEKLQLQVALWPLLMQRLQIVQFKLVGADILFERRRDGTPNWLLGATAEDEDIVTEVWSLGIERSKLAYRAPDGVQIEMRFDDLLAELAPGRPLRVQLNARYHSMPVEVMLDGDTPEALLSPTQAWGFRGTMDAGDFHAEISGKVDDPVLLTGVDVSFRYYGTRSGRLRAALTRQIPKFAEYRGEASFRSDAAGYGFEVNAEGSDAELRKLWSGADEESPLEINTRHLNIHGQGTTKTLSELLALAHWEVAAEDAELRWHHTEGKPPTVVNRATVTAAVRGGGPIEIAVQGRYLDDAISAHGTLGTIKALLAPKEAWRIDAEVKSAEVRGKFDGALRKPLSEALFEGAFDISTNTLSSLGEIVGAELPRSGPARIRGKIASDPKGYRFTGLQAVLGNSRLQGDIAWSETESPRWHVAIAPSEIHFEDLRQSAGPESAPRVEPAGPKQDKVIPAVPLASEWMRAADVELSLDDLRFIDAGKVLMAYDGQLRLANGRLEVKNLRNAASVAPTVANITIDASTDPAMVEVRLDGGSIDYGALLKASGLVDGVEGVLALHARIAGHGNDLRILLQNAEGRVEILGGKGRLSGRLLEVWGGNLIQLINPVSWAEGIDTDLNCIAASFNVRDGMARSELLLLDSRNVTVAGELALDLATERIKGLFKPQPKQASLIKLGTPLRLGGTLSHPNVAPTDRSLVNLGKLVIGIAQPAALIVLFGDLGAKEKDPCAALLARQGAEVAPPKTPDR